jgi:hypothetical protein
MDDRIALFRQCGSNGFGIADIANSERIVGVICNRCEIVQIPRVSQLVEIYNPMVRNSLADELGPNKTSTAGNENGQAFTFFPPLALASSASAGAASASGAAISPSGTGAPFVTFARTWLNNAALRGSTFGGGACS